MKNNEERNELKNEVAENGAVLSDQELDQADAGVKFKYFSIEKCPDCDFWEFMLCNRHYDVCPKCGSKNIRRVFGI